MKGLDPAIDQDFEDELRAMLRRRAADVRANPPDWEDLLRRSGAVVVSFRTGRPVDGAAHRADRRRRRNWSWLRPALAAAACLALVMAAGIAVGRSSSPGSANEADQPGDDETAASGEAGDDILPAAGNPDFQPASATMVFPDLPEATLRAQLEQLDGALPVDRTWMADPGSATEEYLADVGINTAASPYSLWVDPPVLSQVIGAGDDLVDTATVWWSLRDNGAGDTPNPPVVNMGYVFLRDLVGPAGTEPQAWAVVGTATKGLTLGQVRRSGDQLRFAVSVYQDAHADVDTTGVPVQVTVNDTVISEEPLAAGSTTFTHTVPADRAATIRLQQIGDAHPIAVTETLFPAETDHTPDDDRTASP